MNICERGGWTHFELRGRLDSFRLSKFKEELGLDFIGKPNKWAFHIEDVEFINLPTIRFIIELNRQMLSQGGEVVLVSPNPTVAKHLDIYASRTELKVFKDKECFERGEAVASKALYQGLPTLG